MKTMTFLAAATLCFSVALPAMAAGGASCAIQAGDKKLAGAAKNSFMKKCEQDANTKCETSAADKKLAGAAKSSYLKKCVQDAVGPNS